MQGPHGRVSRATDCHGKGDAFRNSLWRENVRNTGTAIILAQVKLVIGVFGRLTTICLTKTLFSLQRTSAHARC